MPCPTKKGPKAKRPAKGSQDKRAEDVEPNLAEGIVRLPSSPAPNVGTEPDAAVDGNRALDEHSEAPNQTALNCLPALPMPPAVAERIAEALLTETDAMRFEAQLPKENMDPNAGNAVEVYVSQRSEQSCRSFHPAPLEDDLKVAEHIAKTRGLPPEMDPKDVRDCLLLYGYDAADHQQWGKSAEHQPELSITLTNHIEFGDHTQYELSCKVLFGRDGETAESSWRTLRRLKHLRAGLHDPVKKALGSRYSHYFGDSPFAHYTAPNGSTARLRAWLASLATCINSGALQPLLVAMALRLLDGPGTPLYAYGKFTFCLSKDFEKIPVTASMFGSKQNIMHLPNQGDLPRIALGSPNGSIYQSSVAKKPLPADIASNGFLEVTFEIEGQDKVVQISRRPLGVEFSKRSSGAVKISKVHAHSHGAELGMEVGWIVKNVGGEDMNNKTFQETQDVLKTGLMSLPDVRD